MFWYNNLIAIVKFERTELSENTQRLDKLLSLLFFYVILYIKARFFYLFFLSQRNWHSHLSVDIANWRVVLSFYFHFSLLFHTRPAFQTSKRQPIGFGSKTLSVSVSYEDVRSERVKREISVFKTHELYDCAENRSQI